MHVYKSMISLTFPTCMHICRENGIKYRQDESVGGWFSQIGEMHQVHHLWGKATMSCTYCLYKLKLCYFFLINFYDNSTVQHIRIFQIGQRQDGQPGSSLAGTSVLSGQVRGVNFFLLSMNYGFTHTHTLSLSLSFSHTHSAVDEAYGCSYSTSNSVFSTEVMQLLSRVHKTCDNLTNIPVHTESLPLYVHI